jgi:Domain of unknown function (DUF1707)
MSLALLGRRRGERSTGAEHDMIDSEKETLIADVGAVAVPDAERERASTELRAHFTAGHLDMGEFSVRLDEVWVAVTTRDIQDALRDLPAEG